MAIEVLTRTDEYTPGSSVPVPLKIRNGLIANETRRFDMRWGKRINPADTQRALDLAVIDFLEFRTEVLQSKAAVSDARLEVGRYTNSAYPDHQPPNEAPNPFSSNRLFIELTNPDRPEDPYFVVSRAQHLVKTGLVGHSKELIETHLSEPDGYRDDEPGQYLDRVSLMVTQINRALDWSDNIVNPTERKETQSYLRSLRAQLGETVFIMDADPRIVTPHTRFDLQRDKDNTPKNIWVQIGRNFQFRLKPFERGPSGISMFDLMHGEARYLVKARKAEQAEADRDPQS